MATLKQLMRQALIRHNTSTAAAHSVAVALSQAEAQGLGGHGLSRLKAYCLQAASGKVNGQATPQVQVVSDALVRIDACSGFAYPALQLAQQHCAEAAASSGICMGLIGNSHHFGAAGLAVEALAKAGQIAILTGNSPQAIAPPGGSQALFGTNPIAFAAPRENAPPLVIDLSLSTVARGKVMLAAQRGEAIPEGWARDADGNPTTDPQAGLQGSMEAIGGIKGAMLALMIEILVAGLTSSNFAFEASSFFTAHGEPPRTAQLLIVIDPAASGASYFSQRLETVLAAMLQQDGVRLPGSNRFEKEQLAEKHGIDIVDEAYDELLQLAG